MPWKALPKINTPVPVSAASDGTITNAGITVDVIAVITGLVARLTGISICALNSVAASSQLTVFAVITLVLITIVTGLLANPLEAIATDIQLAGYRTRVAVVLVAVVAGFVLKGSGITVTSKKTITTTGQLAGRGTTV